MEGSDRSSGHEFCFQLYVSHYVCVCTFEGDRLRRAREIRENRGSASLCNTKENLGERWNEKRRGKNTEGEGETPNPRCTQFGNTARCLDNEALPQSQSPHAERRRQ